jgi:hypothetical protein
LNEELVSYNIGEVIKGSVILSLPKPLEFSEMMLSLEGNEKSKYSKEVIVRNKGHISAGKITNLYDEKHEIISMTT